MKRCSLNKCSAADQPPVQPADWRSDRPLLSEQMYAFLKCYAAWAGLDASKVTYACLRHTAAALRLLLRRAMQSLSKEGFVQNEIIPNA